MLRIFIKGVQQRFIGSKLLATRQFSLESIEPHTLEPVKLAYITYEAIRSSDNIATPLIILHGLFGSKTNWNSLCRAYQRKLNPERQVIAVDARNHGDSPHSGQHSYSYMVADLKELLNDLGIKKATLMGHSMGGRAVALFALQYPDLVDKLIVVDISIFNISHRLSDLPEVFEAMEKVQFPKDVPMSQCRALVDVQLAEKVKSKSLRAFLMTNLVRSNDGNFKWRINLPGLINNLDNIGRVPEVDNLLYDGPTLFLGGGDSDYMPKNEFSIIKKLFPKAELKYIEGAGHFVHAEKPNEFLEITLEFLNRSQ